LTPRFARVDRRTRETSVQVDCTLDGTGRADVRTGIGFLDHMLTSLVLHAGIDVSLQCDGDLQVDDHHSVEDCALALGESVDRALGDRAGIARFGFAYAPLDEALARAVIDLSGRPAAFIEVSLRRERLGTLSCENVSHFFRSLATAMRATLHLDVLRGENDHHKTEACFKALALSLKAAIARQPSHVVPSTKGVLTP
jgi:imidazoleglycerol phosphate dehydratase HisB